MRGWAGPGTIKLDWSGKLGRRHHGCALLPSHPAAFAPDLLRASPPSRPTAFAPNLLHALPPPRPRPSPLCPRLASSGLAVGRDWLDTVLVEPRLVAANEGGWAQRRSAWARRRWHADPRTTRSVGISPKIIGYKSPYLNNLHLNSYSLKSLCSFRTRFKLAPPFFPSYLWSAPTIGACAHHRNVYVGIRA